MSTDPNLITVTRETGYDSFPCVVCRKWGETTDGRDNESFVLAIAADRHGIGGEPNLVKVTLCASCLNVLESQCYVALRERALAGEVA